MNGEPAKTEHEGWFGSNVPEQTVLLTPGPVPERKKFRFCPPTIKTMKGFPGGDTGRFTMVPVTIGSKFPKLVGTLVPEPV